MRSRWGVLLTLACAATQAHADDAADAEKAAQLHARGLALLGEGNPREACALLADAMRVFPKGLHARALGDCQARLGHLLEARRWYQEALGFARKKGVRRETEQDLEAQIAAFDARIPTLRIALGQGSIAQRALTVRRDGVEIEPALWEVAAAVDPGLHVVEVSTPGRPVVRREVQLGEGDRRELSVELASTALEPVGAYRDDAPPTQPTTAPSRRARPVEAWVLGGSSALFAAGGVYAFAARDRHLARRDEACPARCETDAAFRDASDETRRARVAQTYSALSFGAAAVTLVAATAIVWGRGSTVSVLVGPASAQVRFRR